MRFATTLILSASTALAAKSVSVFTAQDKSNYMSYLAKQGKNYKSLAEFEIRMQNWKVADDFIKSYPPSSFTLSHNKFSDLSEIEKKRLLGRKNPKPAANTSISNPHRLEGFCPVGEYRRMFWCVNCDIKCKICSGKFLFGSSCS